MHGSKLLTDVLQDVRYALTKSRREAGFTTFALLIVGLGIGASATIYSVVSAVLLRPLPFAQPERLAWVANNGGEGLSSQTVQVGHFLDLKERARSFEDMAAYFAFYGVGDSKLTGVGEPERLSGVPVSQNFFPLLGVRPQIGRLFEAEECKWNGPRVVVLSHAFWQRRFAGDRGVLGRKLILDDQPVEVVGVLPESFDFGRVFAPGTRIDLFFPFPLTPETNRWGNTLSIVGRLKPGISAATAEAEVRDIAQRLEQEHPERNRLRVRVTPLDEQVSGRLRPALQVLAFAVGMVMLIVCANLSNLQLARTAARQKEMAIRTALGAGRARLIRQTLTESVMLSVSGAL
ncbi:MAG: ABC transporter permease, partial [Bryobacterales bacterium]|nr:ABC transporter permease [Bryobacterales bacterium]